MNFNIHDYKNFIIIFQPWLGGNHLTNILSVNSAFTNRNNNNIVTLYQESTPSHKVAHYGSILNLRRESLILNLPALQSAPTINVMCGHLGECIWAQDLLSQLDKKIYLIMNTPERSSIQFQRIASVNPSLNNLYCYNETKTLYNLDSVSKLTNTLTHDIASMNSNLLFTSNLDDLFVFLLDEFSISYSAEEQQICREMHDVWWKALNNSI